MASIRVLNVVRARAAVAQVYYEKRKRRQEEKAASASTASGGSKKERKGSINNGEHTAALSRPHTTPSLRVLPRKLGDGRVGPGWALWHGAMAPRLMRAHAPRPRRLCARPPFAPRLTRRSARVHAPPFDFQGTMTSTTTT